MNENTLNTLISATNTKKNKKVYNEVVQLTPTSKGLKIEQIFAMTNGGGIHVLDCLISATDRFGDPWKRASAFSFLVFDDEYVKQQKERAQSGQHYIVREAWGKAAYCGSTEESLRTFARRWYKDWKADPVNKGRLFIDHRPACADLFWRAFNNAPEAVQNAVVLGVNEWGMKPHIGHVVRRFVSVEDFRKRAVVSLDSNGEAWNIIKDTPYNQRKWYEHFSYVDKELCKAVKKHTRFEAVNYVEDGQLAI